jgi:hypothetical protein
VHLNGYGKAFVVGVLRRLGKYGRRNAVGKAGSDVCAWSYFDSRSIPFDRYIGYQDKCLGFRPFCRGETGLHRLCEMIADLLCHR